MLFHCFTARLRPCLCFRGLMLPPNALAEEQGASSILASLWPVSDATTLLLMREFYRRVVAPDMSKAEALRQAHLTLLHGTASEPSPPFSPPKDAP